MCNPDVVRTMNRKLAPPLVTLLNSEPEIQYVALRNINLIVQKRPAILEHEIKVPSERGWGGGGIDGGVGCEHLWWEGVERCSWKEMLIDWWFFISPPILPPSPSLPIVRSSSASITTRSTSRWKSSRSSSASPQTETWSKSSWS